MLFLGLLGDHAPIPDLSHGYDERVGYRNSFQALTLCHQLLEMRYGKDAANECCFVRCGNKEYFLVGIYPAVEMRPNSLAL